MGIRIDHHLQIRSRRQLLLGASAVACAPVLPGCEWLIDKPITIASHVWVGYEPLFLARDKGWLNPNQVLLQQTRSAKASIQALFEGKVQGAALTLDEMLVARAAGLSLTLVFVFDISAGADMLVARRGTNTLADLRGRRIGCETSSVGQIMLAQVLQEAQLGKENVQLVPLALDQQADAWARHQVDALITFEPLASQLLNQGAIRLFDSRKIPDTILDVMAMRSDALDFFHASAIDHLVKSHFQALDHLKRNPQDAAYRMTRHLNLPVADVLQAFKGLELPDAASNYRLLSGSDPKLLVRASRLSKRMTHIGLLAKEDSLLNLIQAEFLPTDALAK